LLPTVLEEEKPDAVCMYCGSNDLNAAIGEEQIVGNVLRLRVLVRAYGECVPLAFFSIIKAPQKLSKWDLIERINSRVREELFVEDQLHLTDAAYALMVGTAEPVLADWLRA
jgi:lysophospholipase L1-like esterase|tara:strand:- start:770 stop:1105 length:336 start_codon:yes stop_codon:yes gene_type:complete